jgi:hypothetical protein
MRCERGRCGLFVDDIVSAYATEDEVEWMRLKSDLMSKYESKDLGDAALVVGMRLTRDRVTRSMRVDQQVHVENMLKQFGMTDLKPVDTPEQVGVQLTKEDCPHPDIDVVESYAERRAPSTVPEHGRASALCGIEYPTRHLPRIESAKPIPRGARRVAPADGEASHALPTRYGAPRTRIRVRTSILSSR